MSGQAGSFSYSSFFVKGELDENRNQDSEQLAAGD
jgi:hypothetical protein